MDRTAFEELLKKANIEDEESLSLLCKELIRRGYNIYYNNNNYNDIKWETISPSNEYQCHYKNHNYIIRKKQKDYDIYFIFYIDEEKISSGIHPVIAIDDYFRYIYKYKEKFFSKDEIIKFMTLLNEKLPYEEKTTLDFRWIDEAIRKNENL